MGKTEEEKSKNSEEDKLFMMALRFETAISQKDGIYIHTLKIDYNNIDERRTPQDAIKGFPDTKS